MQSSPPNRSSSQDGRSLSTTVRPLDKMDVVVEHRLPGGATSRVETPAQEATYVLTIAVDEHDGSSIPAVPGCGRLRLNRGESLIQDRRQPCSLPDTVSTLSFHFAASAFDLIADRSGLQWSGTLGCGSEEILVDPTVMAFGLSVLPNLMTWAPASDVLIGSTALALLTHVGVRHGGLSPQARPSRGGLAPWQARRAMEMMSSRLDSEFNVSEVAHECGLSASHFSRAFRNSVGEAPYSWFVRRRLDVAKDLLANADLALAEVALSCGFADQSHFTRTFTRQMGTSPGLWRRCLPRSCDRTAAVPQSEA